MSFPVQQGEKKLRLDWINVLRNIVGGRLRNSRYHQYGMLEPIEIVLTGADCCPDYALKMP